MEPLTPLARLAESAKGWHSIQLGVLGFIGFCGVLRMGAKASGPYWLQLLGTVLSVLAFGFALYSIFLVGKIAYPIGGDDSAGEPAQAAELTNGQQRLRGGIRLTFVAVAMLALAGVTAWWPAESGSATVQVQNRAGASACGVLAEGSPAGILWLETAGGRVTVPFKDVADVRSVSGC